MPTVHLDARALIAVSGSEAEHFLQNLITTDLGTLGIGEAKPGALLTPQGKILFDFLVSRDADGFRLDCRAEIADDLVKRLTLYKLRAKVAIAKEDQRVVAVCWGDESGAPASDPGLRDLRFAQPVRRIHASAPPPADSDLSAWTALRAANGIAESGSDFALSDVFPHDVLYDQNGGVGLKKGCYVGQEVVSRMQHRGTARRRVMVARGARLPEAGSDILVNGRSIGTLGSSASGTGIAVVRIDRVKDALDAGHAILAGDAPIALGIPDWARYTLPETSAAD